MRQRLLFVFVVTVAFVLSIGRAQLTSESTTTIATTTTTTSAIALNCSGLEFNAQYSCSSSVRECSAVCDDAICALSRGVEGTSTCVDGYARFGTAHAARCRKGLRCNRDPRETPMCADDATERQCRSELQQCIERTNNAFCVCYSAFLDCVPAPCSGILAQDCVVSGCTSAQCKNATVPSTIPFCGQYCARLCPTGVDACECPEGRMEPVRLKCQPMKPAPTSSVGESGPIDTGVDWIDENWQLFIALCVIGGVCYCAIYVGLLCLCWKCLPDADEEDEDQWKSDDDLNY